MFCEARRTGLGVKGAGYSNGAQRAGQGESTNLNNTTVFSLLLHKRYCGFVYTGNRGTY